MAGLYTKVCLYLEANSKTWDDAKILLQDDGSGPYIKEWNIDGLAKPSDRRKEYGDIGDQLDEIYKDIDAWKTRIKKIKDDNPKG